MTEKQIYKLIDKADKLMEKNKTEQAKAIYKEAYDNSQEGFTKDTLKEILDNL